MLPMQDIQNDDVIMSIMSKNTVHLKVLNNIQGSGTPAAPWIASTDEQIKFFSPPKSIQIDILPHVDNTKAGRDCKKILAEMDTGSFDLGSWSEQ